MDFFDSIFGKKRMNLNLSKYLSKLKPIMITIKTIDNLEVTASTEYEKNKLRKHLMKIYSNEDHSIFSSLFKFNSGSLKIDVDVCKMCASHYFNNEGKFEDCYEKCSFDCMMTLWKKNNLDLL